jgi:ABC-2 type transport system ATP-binding protein
VNAIDVKGLSKSYDSFQAVKNISFSVPAGQVFAFLGPNGAGKTTTVEILEGYRQRTSGEVSVLGHDPGKASRELRKHIGIVLQECGFPRYSTVAELLTLQGSYYPTSRNVNEVIEVVGLGEKRNDIIRSLSGGQQRRLDLALALIGNPDLIFLDEPTTGFDPSARREAWETIRNLRTLGKTIFLTTHYMDEAQYLADHVTVIAGGEIVASGTPETLGGRDVAATRITFTLPNGTTRAELPTLDDARIDIRGDEVTITTDVATKTANTITSWALTRGDELGGFSVMQPTLEDIYLELVATTESPEEAKEELTK